MKKQTLENIAGWIFIAPVVILMVVFIIGPAIFSFGLSFKDYNLLKPDQSTWVLFENYKELISDPNFYQALFNTLKYSIVVVPVQTFIALCLATVANQKIRGKTFFRVAYYIPAVTSAVASASMFMFLFNTNGIANKFLGLFGFKAVSWFTDPTYALPLAMIMAIWSTVGTQMLVFLAGLQDIPSDVYEAAAIDGATGMQQFKSITIPMLSEKTMFVVVVGMIGTLQMFDQAFIISGGTGGPLGSTTTVVLYLYNKAFGENRLGYGSAVAVCLFIIIFTLTLLQKYYFEERPKRLERKVV
ncbi:sugar ABC transporter permease [Candidatus Epulonipiscium fishelsonii]|uniref:Sugar ABC transporter permease n=1 Tax=Candidatus Epulonipiscium fishelsonii TaxID=77094 RepID=A0ACC8XBH3_9FIRM|nr:sugar ABC transporter permease [Epulopiscium sp. SCG-B11WGA-EpuloA1]ONI40263.1 sugar ABC transporter permease [Epulopiscium sp. SCG-B05WGA-EpuloA1]